MNTVQQICKRGNRPTRQRISRVSDEVNALAQGNQGAILTPIRKELGEKIDRLTKAQPDISALVEKLVTLKRDVNALLKTHSALRRGIQEEEGTAEDMAAEGADETADVRHCLSGTSLDECMQDRRKKPVVIVSNEQRCR